MCVVLQVDDSAVQVQAGGPGLSGDPAVHQGVPLDAAAKTAQRALRHRVRDGAGMQRQQPQRAPPLRCRRHPRLHRRDRRYQQF